MNNLILSTNISVMRNIKQYKFPSKMSETDRKYLNKSIILYTYSIFDKDEIKIENLKNMDSIDRNLYMERDIIPNELYNQEAFILNINDNMFLEINIHDHLRLSIKGHSIDFQNNYFMLKEVLKKYEKQFGFAYDYEFGYKTSNVLNIGSGLTAYAILYLPAIPQTELRSIYQYAKVNNFILYPYNANYPYHYYVLQTDGSIFSEIDMFEKMKQVINYIGNKELKERENIKNNPLKMNKIIESINSISSLNRITEENSIEKISDLFLVKALNDPDNSNSIEHFKLLNKIKKFSILSYKKSHDSNKEEREVRAEIIKDFIEREKNYAKQF